MGQLIKIRWLEVLELLGCYSFYANKVISSGEGGIITTNDKKFYES